MFNIRRFVPDGNVERAFGGEIKDRIFSKRIEYI